MTSMKAQKSPRGIWKGQLKEVRGPDLVAWAKDLLKWTTRGPWRFEGNEGDVGIFDRDGDNVIYAHSRWAEDMWLGTLATNDGRLMAAAPELAALIASARTEFAVQYLDEQGEWRFAREEHERRWQPFEVQIVRAGRDVDSAKTRLVKRLVIDLPGDEQ